MPPRKPHKAFYLSVDGNISPFMTYVFMGTLLLVVMVVNFHHVMHLSARGSAPLRRPVMQPSTVVGQSSLLSEHFSYSKGDTDLQNLPDQYRQALPPRKGEQRNMVKPNDYVYYQSEEFPLWDAAPVIIESHKLIFFTIPKVGCTVWKQLFRRMMGYEDWKTQDYESLLPHNVRSNGLKYLYNYTLEEASIMMTSPLWTRAIMVRDPKRRVLSAFLDKSVGNFHRHIRDRCCHTDEKCIDNAQTMDGFLTLSQVCEDEHWRPQHLRMETKYWPYIDFVLRVENSAEDSKRLLEYIDAWETFGKTGWGSKGDKSIFATKGADGAGEHATYSEWKHWQWLTPEVERRIETLYRQDYENPLLNFTQGECLTCTEEHVRNGPVATIS